MSWNIDICMLTGGIYAQSYPSYFPCRYCHRFSLCLWSTGVFVGGLAIPKYSVVYARQ